MLDIFVQLAVEKFEPSVKLASLDIPPNIYLIVVTFAVLNDERFNAMRPEQ